MKTFAVSRKVGSWLERRLSRFPVLLVACTLIWTGILGHLDHIAFDIGAVPASPISLHCATILLLCGTGILLTQYRPVAARILSLAALAICLPGVVRDSTEIAGAGVLPFGSPLDVKGTWAVLLAALSGSIACCTFGQRCRHLARILALVVVFGSIAITFSPYWAVVQHPIAADTGNLAVVLGVLGGCAVLGLSFRRGRSNPFAPPSIAVIGLTGSLISMLAWYAMTTESRHLTIRHAEAASDRVVHVLESAISEQQGWVSRMAERWAVLAAPSESLIEKEFHSYLRDAPALDLIVLLDSGGRVRRADGDPLVRRRIARELEGQDLKSWLSHVRESGEAHFKSIRLNEGGFARALTAAPISGSALNGWAILMVHNLPKLLRGALGEAGSPIHFQLRDGSFLLYSGAGADRQASLIGERAILLHHDTVWRLSAWDGRSWAHPLADRLPDLVLLACLVFTFFLTRSHRLAKALGERSAQLHHGLIHDPLTGLPNKKHLTYKLRELFRNQSAGQRLSVVMVDLHGLKMINDSMGHDVGDAVLLSVSKRIRAELGANEFLARMEGDEFVFALPRLDMDRVIGITERIIASVAQPYAVGDTELRLSCSAGIAVRDGLTKEHMQLVREADLAVTRAKQEGRNSWYRYSPNLSAEVAERLILRNELQGAIENNLLVLHYQPLVDGNTGRLSGVEALLRWPHEERGYVAPSVFIPLAEETGLVVPLSLWVLDTACRDIAALRARNLADFPVMINVSPSYFQRNDFVETVSATLQKYDVPAHCIEIEITEGVLLDNASYVISKLGELKRLGVTISIDDFGTGYSSLNYLKNLPIDKIKIDRSFVNEIISDRHDAAITRAIIALAHHLNLKVVAEGVETESQYWFLKRNFCDEFQGFLFARPMPLHELAIRLQEQGGCEALPLAPMRKPSDRTLLLLDDEENILRALTRLLRRDGYRILVARTAQEAFSILASDDVQVIVSDQRMPGMTGTEFFSRVKEMYPKTVRLILSGYTDLKSVTEAINRGAIYRFITKPWDDEELRSEIAQAFKGVAVRDQSGEDSAGV